jgi:hypothetical protein
MLVSCSATDKFVVRKVGVRPGQKLQINPSNLT